MKANNFFIAANAAGISVTEPVHERNGTGLHFGLGRQVVTRPLSEQEVVNRIRHSKDPNHQAFLVAYYSNIFQR